MTVPLDGEDAMSERYEREIEEILQQVGDSTPAKESEEAKRNSLLAPFARIGRGIGNHVYLSSGRLLTIGIVLLLVAVFVSAMFPGPWGPFVWLGLILFVLIYALFFARPNRTAEKLWRGRPIEQQPPTRRGEDLWERFQRWLKR